MNLKSISIFLVVFFLAIAAVSAADKNITDNGLLNVAGDCEDLSVSFNDNVSLSVAGDDCLSVSSDNVSLSAVSGDCLSVCSDNVSLASVNELPVSVSVESSLSALDNESKLSMPTDPDDSKLTSIYDKVYSKKQWKYVWLCSINLKYTWSEKKMKKVCIYKLKKNRKKIVRTMIKYAKKGWHYNTVYYRTLYGKHIVKAKYYLQFYRTVYYNGYGETLYVG